jgi:hypothetical protein
MQNVIWVLDTDISQEDIDIIKEKINNMKVSGNRIVTNSIVTCIPMKINRNWINPFYCENFAIFMMFIDQNFIGMYDSYLLNMKEEFGKSLTKLMELRFPEFKGMFTVKFK